MPLNAKTTNIPTNTGKILANSVDLTKVIANGVVVWEKQTQIDLINATTINNGGTFTYFPASSGTIKSDNQHFMSTSGGRTWIYSRHHSPCTEDGDTNQVINRIAWSNIDLSSFSKIKLTYSIHAATSTDGYALVRLYLGAGNLTTNVVEGRATAQYYEDEEDKEDAVNDFDSSGTIELNIASLTGNQNITVNLFHEGQDAYQDGEGDWHSGYISEANLYITKLELS